MSEDSQHGPRAEFDDGRDSARQNAWQILSDTAARNVRHRRHAFCGDELLRYPPIAAVGLHELVADFAFDLVDVSLRLVFGDFEEQLAGERKSVGVQAGGGQAENNVSGLDGLASDNFLAFDHADDESGKIVFAFGIEAGHLRGFAADERAAVVLAGFGEAFDDFFGDARFEFPNGEIVHEKHGRGALNGNVINAVVHEVGADRVVDLHLKCKL